LDLNSRDNPLLTGIRGVAAIWVILFHSYPWYAEVIGGPARGAFPFVRDGFLGVDLFFLLSGFVLTMSYGPRLSGGSFTAIGQFMISRAFRILPMHWAVLVVLAAIVGMVPS
jgi:peptidoglycan/LPS O-acetylase OafA/YrhL